MKANLLLPFLVLAAGFVSGCGDPAPSVQVAPDRKMPDVSKMSKEQTDALIKGDKANDRK